MSRYTNPDQLREYAHSYRNKFQAELLTETEEMEEFMFLGLRKMNGISKKEFSDYLDLREAFRKHINIRIMSFDREELPNSTKNEFLETYKRVTSFLNMR